MLSLEQILKLPVSEIERNGLFFLTVIREWRRLTGKEPRLCGCDGRANINYVKNYFMIVCLYFIDDDPNKKKKRERFTNHKVDINKVQANNHEVKKQTPGIVTGKQIGRAHV